MREFPRWLYRGGALADGVIVHDEDQAADAEAKGYCELDAAAQAQPTAVAPSAAPVAAAPVGTPARRGRPRKLQPATADAS